MADRPMLMSASMVRAILAGTKTQTRRVFKTRNGGVWPNYNDIPGMRQIMRNCPYGQPGDRLWVRESFWEDLDGTIYKADQERGSPWLEVGAYKAIRTGANGTPYVSNWGWRPSIHMPRRASRITLEVTGVRVERLQDISVADAIAEGVNIHPDHHSKPRESIYSPVQAYRDLWESINGPGSWEANPWVWVVEFKRIEVPA